MDFNVLMLSFVFGMIGLGMFQYGRNAGRMVPLAMGIGLMVLPYFISNLIAMVIVCMVMMATPLVVRQ
jgi:hypothetical protein